MSCALTAICEINDVNRIGNLLQDPAVEDQDIVDQGFGENVEAQSWSDGWDSSEEWNTTIEQNISKTTAKKSWVQSCKISLSPSEELLVIAEKDKCVFLTKKWTTNAVDSETPYYEVFWNGCLSQESDDTVTSISCIPLASQQRSSGGSPDWTCVIAGFSSGYIRIFMTNGKLLLAQYLHDEPVVNIKLKTKMPFHRLGEGDQVDELMILYPNAIVTIDGFSLYQSLRACRNQLARAQASSTYGDMLLEPPPLEYHKWRVNTHSKVNDIASCGTKNLCLFDRLQAASVLEGPRGVVKGSAPAFTSIISTGKEPFLAVFHATEGNSQPILSDVALAVASKLTSAVYSKITAARSWFGGGHAQETSPMKDTKPKIERGTLLNNTVCLPDSVRHAESIKVAPVGHLAVVTDSFNRVLLIDTQIGVVIRMWKGYRDAGCGWVVVDEDLDETQQEQPHTMSQAPARRRALFLVIHAPKRGIMEIYLMEHGSRVGAFYVGKDCRLICPGYRTLGQTQSHYGNNHVDCYNQCFLLQSDGILKSIQVPFHLALSTTHSVHAKDAHLLKRLSTLIEKSSKSVKNPEELCKSFNDIILEIQVPTSQTKAVELLLNASHFSASFLQSCTIKLIKNLKNSKKENTEEDLQHKSEREELLLFCKTQLQLIDLYIAIDKLKMSKEGSDSEIDFSEGKGQAVTNLLHITLSEAEHFIISIEKYTESCLEKDSEFSTTVLKAKVPCEKDTLMDISTFLSCFHIDIKDNKDRSDGVSTSHRHCVTVEVQESLSPGLLSVLAGFFFREKYTCVYFVSKIRFRNSVQYQFSPEKKGHCAYKGPLVGDIPVSKLTLVLESSQLHPQQLMMLLALYTQSESSCDILNLVTLFHLTSLVSSICSIKGGYEKESSDQVGKVSSWWQLVREILQESTTIGASYVMSFVCRSVAMELNAAAQKIKKEDESDITSGGWEAVTMDMEQWNFLVNQLENLLELDRFVHTNHSLSVLSGMESPSFNQHRHKKNKTNEEKDKQASKRQTIKISQRIPLLSVKGLTEAGYGAIAQIVADCLVRQGVPGPCLGIPKPKSILRERTTTVSSCEDTYEEDDLPDQEDQNYVDTLSTLVEMRKIFPFSLEQDILWIHCAWECIMVWNEDCEDIGMLASALVHLSCVHNPVLKEGLSVMMWKTVYKDSVKELTSLIDKVGKAPKDRLCKKTVSLGYKALEEFLSTAKRLLEIIMENEFENDDKPVLREEELWLTQTTQRSIAEQAMEQHCCNRELLKHQWCHVTVLYLVMLSGVKSVKPSSLFDTKGRHALFQSLHVTPLLSKEMDDAIMKTREKFYINVAKSFVENHFKSTSDDERLRNSTTELLYHLDILLELSKRFLLDEDYVRRHISCELYTAGLDLAAQEMAMLIHDKDTFSAQMLEVVRKRLAISLLNGDGETISNTLSKLPTKITSWLQNVDLSKVHVPTIPLANTYHLLQYLHSNAYGGDSRDYRFINELIEGLQLFLP